MYNPVQSKLQRHFIYKVKILKGNMHILPEMWWEESQVPIPIVETDYWIDLYHDWRLVWEL